MRALSSHQCGPLSNPGINAICWLSLFLVLSFAPRGFFHVLQFSPLLKNQHFQILIQPGNQVAEEPLSGCATSKPLFIYLFIYLFNISMF